MRILLIELSDSFLDSIAGALGRAGFGVERVAGRQLPRLAGRLDGVLGVLVGAAGAEDEWPRLVGDGGFGCPWAIAGAAEGTRAAVAALRHGASDYFTLPREIDFIPVWAADLREAHPAADANAFGMIGRSPRFLAAVRRLARVIADGRSSVLILGETGTGKELFARALHAAGPRAAAPFVELNCAAIPPTLLESELFGHEAGAFTDARNAKPGLFEMADRGTFFLDEIGDLPLEMQAKLLRVLDYRRVRRVGGLSETEIDVRLVAATHRDLDGAVQAGAFREDLLYRLNVIQLHLPPLRERREDIIPLVRFFLSRFCAQYSRPEPVLTPETAAALQRHRWPGNVRELRNAVERGLLLGQGRLSIEEMIPAVAPRRDEPGTLPFPAPLDLIASRAAELMLQHHNGNKSSAAEALGVSRKRLYSLLQARQPAVPG